MCTETTPGVRTDGTNDVVPESEPAVVATENTSDVVSITSPAGLRVVNVMRFSGWTSIGVRTSAISSSTAVSDSMSAAPTCTVSVRVAYCHAPVADDGPAAPWNCTVGALGICQSSVAFSTNTKLALI